MLHHGDPTVRRARRYRVLAFFDVFESDLAVFICVGVNRRAGEGAVKIRITTELAVIANQLRVDRRCNRCGAAVLDIVLDADVVLAAFQGVGFADFHAALLAVQHQLY